MIIAFLLALALSVPSVAIAEPVEVVAELGEAQTQDDVAAEVFSTDAEASEDIEGISEQVENIRQLLLVYPLSEEDALINLPEGSADSLQVFMQPFIWGMCAGFVAYLIGLSWRSMLRLMGTI